MFGRIGDVKTREQITQEGDIFDAKLDKDLAILARTMVLPLVIVCCSLAFYCVRRLFHGVSPSLETCISAGFSMTGVFYLWYLVRKKLKSRGFPR
jgi:hypothetical protein